jgi:hypothetical protein
MTDIKIVGNRVVLEGHRIKNLPMLAEYEVVTTEETLPWLDEYNKPLLNDNGEPIVYSKFSKVSRVLLKPQEVNNNAIQKSTAEKVDVRKQTRNGKKMGKGNTEKEIAEESQKE